MALAVVAVVTAAFGATSLLAQQGATPAQPGGASPPASPERQRLAAMADSLERRVASGTLKGRKLDAARAEAEALRSRLRDGDFEVGDRLVITVLHDQVVTDTASVRDGRLVAVRGLPDASVQGVLRTELADHLRAHVARFLRDADVRVNILTRVGVFGGVRSPGYRWVSPDRPVTDVLTEAGGLGDAAGDKVVVERAGKRIVDGTAMRRAMEQGTTVAQLGIQSGDVVSVETKRRSINWFAVLRTAGLAVGLVMSVVSAIQLYYLLQQDQ